MVIAESLRFNPIGKLAPSHQANKWASGTYLSHYRPFIAQNIQKLFCAKQAILKFKLKKRAQYSIFENIIRVFDAVHAICHAML